MSIYPRNLQSKIIFALLLVFSLFCISDIITGLTDFNFISDEKLLIRSVKDALNKNVSLCTSIVAWILRNITEDASEDVLKFVNLSTETMCPAEYLPNQVRIASQIDSEYDQYIARYNSEEKKIEVLDLNLPTTLAATYFAPNSPFKNKFVEMYRKFYEFGFDKKLAVDFQIRIYVRNNKSHNLFSDAKVLLIILSFLMTTGVVLSLVSFLIEKFYYSYINRIEL